MFFSSVQASTLEFTFVNAMIDNFIETPEYRPINLEHTAQMPPNSYLLVASLSEMNIYLGIPCDELDTKCCVHTRYNSKQKPNRQERYGSQHDADALVLNGYPNGIDIGDMGIIRTQTEGSHTGACRQY
uniref:AlNc14C12G1479 protein n=1 Tax=Albugo laibachii Nc14 TaxID=890382 RepID=F0W3A2_9STRA|nr:AlNc14C12G1479 [Albugo laibachii Nc14]|eukprot:CCA15545.1 AlNc14C12G1479 [Albugo laibachii Nc14]